MWSLPRSFAPGRFRPVLFLFRRFPWPRIPFNVSVTGSVRFGQSSDRKRPGNGGKFPLNFRPESGAKELAEIWRNRPGSIETVSEPTQFWTDPVIGMINLGNTRHVLSDIRTNSYHGFFYLHRNNKRFEMRKKRFKGVEILLYHFVTVSGSSYPCLLIYVHWSSLLNQYLLVFFQVIRQTSQVFLLPTSTFWMLTKFIYWKMC